MKKYGRITIVTPGVFTEGLIVEVMSGDVVARKYYKSEYDEPQVSGEIEIDIIAVARMTTPTAQMKEIAAQIGTNKFFIDEEVISKIKDLRRA